MTSTPLIGVTTFGGDGGLSGISQYIVQVLKGLATEPREARYEVVAYADEAALFVPGSPRFTALPYGRRWASPVPNLAWHQAALPVLCARRRFDALFLPAANRRLPAWAPCPTVGTVHDLAAVHVTDKYDAARGLYIRRVLPPLIRRHAATGITFDVHAHPFIGVGKFVIGMLTHVVTGSRHGLTKQNLTDIGGDIAVFVNRFGDLRRTRGKFEITFGAVAVELNVS